MRSVGQGVLRGRRGLGERAEAAPPKCRFVYMVLVEVLYDKPSEGWNKLWNEYAGLEANLNKSLQST